MKKSRRILTGLMALTLALSFTACSTSKTTNGSGDGSKKVKLKVIGQKRPDQPEYVQKQIDKRIETFKKKYPNVELELVNFGSATDYRQEYDKQLMAGTAPDVIDFLPFVDIPSRIANHTVGDLSEFVNDWDLKKQNKVANYFDGAV
ncbi:extracellular solute-binding protein, partial [Clostridiaceae bacterium UIB06]|nr:extracellular solute-binding protein [Clostridiaceae bacterium UIB06]